MNKKILQKREYHCQECDGITLSSTGYCFGCWNKKNELAQWLIIKKADKEDNPKDLK